METLGEDRQILLSVSKLCDINNSVNTSREGNSEESYLGE